MKKILAFLRWEFKGCTKSASFWGGLTSGLGVVMLFGGCPNPYPQVFIGLGLGLTFGDLIYTWFKFRIAMYKLDQEQIVSKLKG